MSATLVARDVSAVHGARTVFSGADLTIGAGDVVGLVGANGAGKSTFLRILAGLEKPDTGTVELAPPTATVGHLPQEPAPRPGETIEGFLARRTGVAAAQAELDAATADLEAGGDGERYSVALERWLDLGAADLADRVPEVADDLGLALGLDTPMTTLSGGQAARVNLAALLLARFDVFLLDEPTNDLDLAGLERLERFVRELRAPTVVVSHDREFLARTVTGVLELDLAQQQVDSYGGGYESYLAERAVARRHAREAYDEYADKRSALESRMQTQRNWLEHGVRNARRKGAGKSDNDKNARKVRTESTEKQASKVAQSQRRIERLEVVEEPRKEWELRMTIAAAPRSGTVVAALSEAVVRRGDFTLGPVTLQLDHADRVVVTGANGAGKTTLLGLLLGRIVPDAGSARLGSGVVIGEVDQARSLFASGTLLDAFSREPEVDRWPTAEVRTLLAKFGLGAEHVHRPADSLSPGERTRAALALLQARGVNLLVLDEPTNHLDLPAIEQLESALESFPGTVLLVTHDRRMLDTVRTTRHWHVESGRVTEAR
ncbi:ABC-F family ATP-binding cassette domain-containing protein [Actinomycetospora termitidis]|uniref:ABC-F family ATP-binding cassette domain-containing protein n=1 Tax=Actinomycetospora termitidis TaxID=3053470 RepID=A0ABT7M339_9PSEU|nr:ABC-F family ATP-binding cassette domain-containing protein [Actinomycetospora sp. Odt1-22]MDL5155059.1 ABC-F family ATP-binding cassette domain-containing protein [Actinomycetospora sp. Odt1-22]